MLEPEIDLMSWQNAPSHVFGRYMEKCRFYLPGPFLSANLNPSPVFSAFDAVHGHFTDVVFIGQLLNGDPPVFIMKLFLDFF